jgi:autotransporter-associated beta strand protein
MQTPPSQIKLRRAFSAALSSLGILLAGSSLQAANEAWSTNTPGPADGNFGGTNWTVGTTGVATPTNAAASGDALFFDTSAITTLNNDLSSATFAGITFNSGASAYTIGGNAFTLSGALTNNSSSLQTFSNAITLAAAQTITGAGNISLSGNLGGGGTSLTKSGTGTLSLSGTTNAISGNLLLSAGRLNVTAGTTNFAGAFSKIADTASTTAIASISSGATLGWTGNNGGNFGGAASASGVLYNAGTLNQTGTIANSAGIYLGNANNAYGYFYNTGTTNVSGRVWISQNDTTTVTNGAVGLLDIASGTVTVTGTNQAAAFQVNASNKTYSSTAGFAGVNVTGGGTLALSPSQTYQINTGVRLYSSLNISGAGSKITTGATGGFNLNNTSNALNTSTFTISNGGEVDTSFISNTGSAASIGILTFNNGTLKATAADATALIRSGVTTYIQSGGATINTNGFNTTVATALQAPSGSGVTNITLGGTLTGYAGAPIVQISGGGGTGAAAVANFDPTTGTITGITITSAGSGYTSVPTVTLVGGNGGSTGAGAGTATATASIGAVTSGGLTKTGTGTLTLSATNTFIGATVSAGTLATTTTGTFGAGNVTVAAGAALTFGNSASIGDLATLFLDKTSTASSINLNFSGSETVGAVSISSTYLDAGTYDSTQLNSLLASMGGNALFTGSGSLTISAIPEPATYAALCGALALGVAAIRRRKTAA